MLKHVAIFIKKHFISVAYIYSVEKNHGIATREESTLVLRFCKRQHSGESNFQLRGPLKIQGGGVPQVAGIS